MKGHKMRTCFLLSIFLLVFAKGFSVDLYGDPSLEMKTGYFFFADSKMRSVYNEGGLDLN